MAKVRADLFELLAHRFRVLGEPFRLRLLSALQPGEQSVNALVQSLEASQPNVSKHLQLLAAAGFVLRRRSGNTVFYSIADPSVFKVCTLALRSAEKQMRDLWKELSDSGKARQLKKK